MNLPAIDGDVELFDESRIYHFLIFCKRIKVDLDVEVAYVLRNNDAVLHGPEMLGTDHIDRRSRSQKMSPIFRIGHRHHRVSVHHRLDGLGGGLFSSSTTSPPCPDQHGKAASTPPRTAITNRLRSAIHRAVAPSMNSSVPSRLSKMLVLCIVAAIIDIKPSPCWHAQAGSRIIVSSVPPMTWAERSLRWSEGPTQHPHIIIVICGLMSSTDIMCLS